MHICSCALLCTSWGASDQVVGLRLFDLVWAAELRQ